MSLSPVIELEAVRFSYGGAPVLKGVNLALPPGELVVLAGPNGSGKSTLLKLLVGLLRPQSGTVRLLGGTPHDAAILRRIGYAPQGLRVVTSVPVSVREVVEAGLARVRAPWKRSPGSRRRVQAALEAVGMAELAGECLFELSGGQQQRAIIGRALVGDPSLLLLDEPTTGIDRDLRPKLVKEFRRRADEGANVVVVSHDPDDFHDASDRILVIADGAIRQLTHDEFHHQFHDHAGTP